MKLCKIGIAVFALSSAGAIAATSPTSVDSPQSSNPGYTSPQSQLAPADSAQVSQIQQMLTDKGYKVGAVDGQMGTKTKSALKQFQQSQGLQASGRIDAQTLAALGTTSAASSAATSSSTSQQGMPQQSSSQQGSSGFSPQSSDTSPATTSPATTSSVTTPSTTTSPAASSPGMSGTKAPGK